MHGVQKIMRLSVRLALAVVVGTAVALPCATSGQDQKDKPIVITAEELGKEYDKNAKATDKKYEGKVLEVTGTVKMAMQVFSSPFVGLEGSKKATYGIYCETKDEQPWARFAPGQKVKVTGIYTAGISGPQLKDCEVKAVDPNPALVVTAEALAKEFSANKDQANKKYANKTLLVSGKIKSTEFLPGGGFTDITLEGSGKMGVIVRLHNSQQELGKKLKAGESITLAGPFSYLDGNSVRVDMSFPVTKEKK